MALASTVLGGVFVVGAMLGGGEAVAVESGGVAATAGAVVAVVLPLSMSLLAVLVSAAAGAAGSREGVLALASTVVLSVCLSVDFENKVKIK